MDERGAVEDAKSFETEGQENGTTYVEGKSAVGVGSEIFKLFPEH